MTSQLDIAGAIDSDFMKEILTLCSERNLSVDKTFATLTASLAHVIGSCCANTGVTEREACGLVHSYMEFLHDFMHTAHHCALTPQAQRH